MCTNIRHWHWNRRGNINVKIFQVWSKFVRQISKTTSPPFWCQLTNQSSFPMALSPYFSCMVGGSSDSCHLCQFMWDSAEQTALSHNMRPKSGKQFPLMHTCFFFQLIKTERKASHWGNLGIGIGPFIAFVLYFASCCIMINVCFNCIMLEGVWIIELKFSQNKMAAVLTKSLIRHFPMLYMDCQHVISVIKPCHQKLVLSINPLESVGGGSIFPTS